MLQIYFRMLSIFEPVLKLLKLEKIKTDSIFFQFHYKVKGCFLILQFPLKISWNVNNKFH